MGGDRREPFPTRVEPIVVGPIMPSSKESTHPQIADGDHKAYMEYALSKAELSPPKPSNFCVGALVVDTATNSVLATGYTLELKGNTHAEQCCFMKLAQRHGVDEAELGEVLPATGSLVLYTTMEPCNKRSPGNMTCVDRILRCAGNLRTVYAGVLEPEKFVGENLGRTRLLEAGIQVVLVKGLEERILEVATAGHSEREEV